MRALSATELVCVWERGSNQAPVQRALTLLAAACPDAPPDALPNLSIGQRDVRLLALRELTFGAEFTGLADCPACHEKIELVFNAADIRADSVERGQPGPRNPSATGETRGQGFPRSEPPAELQLQMEGYDLRFRLPTSADLLAVSSREELFDRCLLQAARPDTESAAPSSHGVPPSGVPGAGERPDRLSAELQTPVHGPGHLSEQIIRAIAEKMSRADPMADIQLALDCSSCGCKWEAAFDIVAFFWREINAAARSLLREVHILACAYGWTESEILALSPVRRRFYLETVSG